MTTTPIQKNKLVTVISSENFKEKIGHTGYIISKVNGACIVQFPGDIGRYTFRHSSLILARPFEVQKLKGK